MSIKRIKALAANADGWIGVDLDGTLAYYDQWRGPTHIGAPIAEMVDRVRRWLRQGRDVRVFTARIADPSQADVAIAAIDRFCIENFGRKLPVVCQKDMAMVEIWDDRAIRVVKNEGVPCCPRHALETASHLTVGGVEYVFPHDRRVRAAVDSVAARSGNSMLSDIITTLSDTMSDICELFGRKPLDVMGLLLNISYNRRVIRVGNEMTPLSDLDKALNAIARANGVRVSAYSSTSDYRAIFTSNGVEVMLTADVKSGQLIRDSVLLQF